MKPPPFDYYDPTVLADALQLLAEHGRDIKILAGGQSLLQLLNYRLIRPPALLDINRVAELHLLEQDAEGLKVGATIRQSELEKFPGLAEINPLLAEALPWIGHFQTRNRGTVCGSLANADPAAELPAVSLTLEARLTLERNGGQRVVSSRKFFKAALTTVLEPEEMLTHVSFPAWNYGDGWALEQVARRPQDFALVGVVVLLTPAEGACARARITVFGTGYPPARCEAAESFLNGNAWSASLLDEAVARVRTETKARSDAQATSEYRRHVAGTLAGRALLRAAQRAGLTREDRHG
ncbi:MAG: FAD binding domain-containing protein [Pyrinomonadaceae bacterium]|nr:FAD binding domain-containing protein [Pyrinomonadaceae bacterium]